MVVAKRIVVSEGMLKALWFINTYRYLAPRQVAAATGLKEKSASEMLLRLERQKLLGSFGNVGIRGYGKTPKLYYLTRSGHALMAEELESLGWHVEPFRQVSGSTRWSPIMFHRLDVIDCLVALEQALWRVPGYALAETYIEYRRRKLGRTWVPETADFVAKPHISSNKIVPDAGFALEHEESGRIALFLLEVDRATERLTTDSAVAVEQSFVHKMRQYDRYLESEELGARYAGLGQFVGPVVLTVTTTSQRVANMRQTLAVCNPDLHQRFRFSTMDALRNNFLHNHWLSRDSDDAREHRLIKGT
jgi:hypothetical protein